MCKSKNQKYKKNTATNLMKCFGNETLIDEVDEGGDDSEVDEGGDDSEEDDGGDDSEVDDGGDDSEVDDGSDDDDDQVGMAAKIWADMKTRWTVSTTLVLRYGTVSHYTMRRP